MGITSAVLEKIERILKERRLSYTGLARIAGITPSTIYSMKSHADIGITTIKKICDGLEISLSEFFSDELFDELQQEIE